MNNNNKFSKLDFSEKLKMLNINTSGFSEIENRLINSQCKMDKIVKEGNMASLLKHNAIINTAKNTEEIKRDVSGIRIDLKQESEDRKQADDENMKYVKKQDLKNFVLGVIGAVIGCIGTIIAIAALIVSIVKS